MDIRTLAPDHTDERGTITDLVEGLLDAVTIVRSKKGAIRGNHLHKHTDQWAYVLSGRLLVVTNDAEAEVRAGQMVFNPAGEPHAWRALEDTVCVVAAAGPRAGQDYEMDTYRLQDPLIQAAA